MSIIYSLYKSGIYEADVMFGKSILHKQVNQNEFEKLENDCYDISLLSINNIYDELVNLNLINEDCFTLLNGNKYNRYININDATIWVLRGVKSPVDIILKDNELVGFITMSRGGSTILVRQGYEFMTPLVWWEDPLLSKANHTINHLGTFMVEMTDGIKLATEVWLPNQINNEEKVPTILIRTCYGRKEAAKQEFRFVRRNYALVVQDVRGRDDSEGDWIPYYHEKEDGNDTLNWIAKQTWSDGNIGTIGGSYLGSTQWSAASKGNPHLKAIVSLVTAGSAFYDVTRRGGTISSGSLAWVFMMSDKFTNKGLMERNDWEDILNIRPLVDIPQKAIGRKISFWDKWLRNNSQNEFWNKSRWSLHGDKINVPALIISGWYDDNGMGTTEAWEMNKKYNRDNIKLIFGPWYHKANTTRDIHNIPFGDNAIRYDLDLMYLKWFDRFLKGINNGIEKTPKVEYYLVGDNKWCNATTWPPVDINYYNLYIGSEGKLSSSISNDSLPDVFEFDPKDPAPHIIDLSENELSVPEIYNEVESRKDVLTYTSKELEEDISIAGDIYFELYASSSARDTDWVIRLTDVDELGNSIRLTEGVLRARFRNSFEKEELLEPNKIYKYNIRMAKIANTFKKNHKIRIQITSGAKNLVFPNHNTGNDPTFDEQFKIAIQSIYHNEKYRSHIKLPILSGNINDL